jgi:signal transduction histidine kinase
MRLAARLGRWPVASGVHRQVVQVAVVVGTVSAALLFGVGLLADEPRLFTAAAGPAAATLFMLLQTMMRRFHAGVALYASAALIAASAYLRGMGDNAAAVSVVLVVMCALASMLVDSHRVAAVVIPALALLFLPALWGLGDEGTWTLGIVNAAMFAVAAFVLSVIRAQVQAYSERYRVLFDESPAAILEEDWSAALAYLRSEYEGKPERIEKFLLAYPRVLRTAVGKARVVRANRAAAELLEAPSIESLLGYRVANRVRDINLEAWASILGAIYRGERYLGIDIASTTRRGRKIWVQVRGADLDPEHPASSILVGLADVTHNHERSDAMAELVRAKNDFIAQVSHELRTPLTVVVGLASELEQGEDLSDEDREELTRLVAGQAREVAGIVEDLLVAARTELGTMTVDNRVVDLAAELSATVEGLGMDVDIDLPRLPPVLADATRVRQILRNLLTNAMRYGGPSVFIRGGATEGTAWVEVRDDGPGVPEDMEEAIFEPYATTGSGASQAVGIGLSVSRQLAELMRGSLTYRRDGYETVFCLSLPRSDVGTASQLASQGAES